MTPWLTRAPVLLNDPITELSHDSRKAEAPWRAAEVREMSTSWRGRLLNLNSKLNVRLKCHCVPIKCSSNQSEALKK